MQRRPARIVWLPAQLLWVPALLLGVVFLAGVDVDADPVAEDWRVRIDVPLPGSWVDGPLFWPGVVLTTVGVVFWLLHIWQPSPDRVPLTVALFPRYLFASLFFLLAGVVALLGTSGKAFDATEGLMQFRFLLEPRQSIFNKVTGYGLLAVSAVLFAFSFGGARRAQQGSAPAAERGPRDQANEA